MKTRNRSRKVIRRTRRKGYYKGGGIFITNATRYFGNEEGINYLINYEIHKKTHIAEVSYHNVAFVEQLGTYIIIMKTMDSTELNTYLSFYVKLLEIIIKYFVEENKHKKNEELKQYYKFFNDVYIKTLLDIKADNNENKITVENKKLMYSLYTKFNELDKIIKFRKTYHNKNIIKKYGNLINPLGQSLNADSSSSSASTVDADEDDEHQFQIEDAEQKLIEWLKNTKKSSRRV
jgi:hypothetical protein